MSKEQYELGSLASGVEIAMPNCSQIQRTDEIVLINEAPVVVTICFAQLKCRYDVPPPYIKDTGVFVLATNLNPGGISNIDSCDIGGNGNPIASTSASGSCEVEFPNGSTQTVNLAQWPEADEGMFYRYVGWRIAANTATSLADGSEVGTLSVQPIVRGAQEGFRKIET